MLITTSPSQTHILLLQRLHLSSNPALSNRRHPLLFRRRHYSLEIGSQIPYCAILGQRGHWLGMSLTEVTFSFWAGQMLLMERTLRVGSLWGLHYCQHLLKSLSEDYDTRHTLISCANNGRIEAMFTSHTCCASTTPQFCLWLAIAKCYWREQKPCPGWPMPTWMAFYLDFSRIKSPLVPDKLKASIAVYLRIGQ